MQQDCGMTIKKLNTPVAKVKSHRNLHFETNIQLNRFQTNYFLSILLSSLAAEQKNCKLYLAGDKWFNLVWIVVKCFKSAFQSHKVCNYAFHLLPFTTPNWPTLHILFPFSKFSIHPKYGNYVLVKQATYVLGRVRSLWKPFLPMNLKSFNKVPPFNL